MIKLILILILILSSVDAESKSQSQSKKICQNPIQINTIPNIKCQNLETGQSCSLECIQGYFGKYTATCINQNRWSFIGNCQETKQPNIIFILTDDQSKDMYEYMPTLQERMVKGGTKFTRYINQNPECAPSRTTILTGKSSHNTKIWDTDSSSNSDFIKGGFESDTISLLLQKSGYVTHISGKYINGYPFIFNDNFNVLLPNETYVPPGWDDWNVIPLINGQDGYEQYNYTMNENGKLNYYGDDDKDYGTDVIADKAITFINSTMQTNPNQPFFMYISTFTPHQPSIYPSRYKDYFLNTAVPQSPNFNQLQNKTSFWKICGSLSSYVLKDVVQRYQDMQRCVLAIDDIVDKIYRTLEDLNILNNTYVMLTTDNGFIYGNHRIKGGKITSFEETLTSNMFITGPNVRSNYIDFNNIVSNLDMFQTWADIANITQSFSPKSVDGYSLLPLININNITSKWRQIIEIEHGLPGYFKNQTNENDKFCYAANAVMPSYFGLRTSRYTYTEYSDGSKELYDIVNDIYSINNLVDNPNYNCTVKYLSKELSFRYICAGDECRENDTIFQNLLDFECPIPEITIFNKENCSGIPNFSAVKIDFVNTININCISNPPIGYNCFIPCISGYSGGVTATCNKEQTWIINGSCTLLISKSFSKFKSEVCKNSTVTSAITFLRNIYPNIGKSYTTKNSISVSPYTIASPYNYMANTSFNTFITVTFNSYGLNITNNTSGVAKNLTINFKPPWANTLTINEGFLSFCVSNKCIFEKNINGTYQKLYKTNLYIGSSTLNKQGGNITNGYWIFDFIGNSSPLRLIGLNVTFLTNYDSNKCW